MGIGDCPNCFITKSEDDHYGHTSGSSGSTSGGGYNNDNCGDNDRRKTTKISKKFNKIRNVIFGGGKRVIFYGPEFQKRYEKERRNRIRKRDLLRDCCTTSGGETPSKSHTDIQISKPIITSTETDKQTMGRSDLKTLRQLCVETLASMPYGGAILEELATVSESLSHLTKAKEDQMRNVIPIPVPTERSPSPPPLPPPVAPARNRRKIIVQQQYEPPLPSPPLPSPPPPPIPSPPKFDDDEFVSAAVDDEFKNKNYASIQPNAISTQDFIEYDRKLTPSHNQRPIDEQALAEQIISPSAHQKQKENVPQHQREIEMEIKREEDGNKNVVRDEENMTIGTAAGAAANSNMKNRLLAIIRETEQEQQQSTTENSTNTPNESENSEIKQNSETNRNTNPDPDNMFAYQNYKSTLTGPGSQTDDIFEEFNKRFSNIEQSFRPLSVNLDNVTKRYSNLETSSFETKKRLENGNIVFETFDKNRQKLSSVDGKIIENHNDSESKLVGNHDKNVKNEKIAENKMYENFPHQQKLQDEKLHQQHKTQEQHSTKTQTESQTDQKSSPPQQQQQQPSQPPKDEFIFKEFDFVPKTIKTDQFFTTPRQSTPADTTNLHQEKSKSHHNIFFGKPNPFEELNEEFKRKFETQLRSPNLGARPLSLHETMRLNSNNFSDWMKHAKTQMTTESSENITKPLLKEEFMVRGGRSFSTAEIRAPRISPNVMDSAEQYEEIHRQYDSSVGRRNQVLQTRQSMIDQTPITGHVSMERTRRMSLPKELHDKQLSYIRQKERELQVEFERLEAERRKLEKEMTDWSENVELQAQNFGSQQLSEAEEFRQKMHNEWLNKVAEREERRMQKIVKISKSSDDAPIKSSSARNDLGDEFLHKVKERRSKLNMPSDSDWESGAESQPTPKPTDDSTPKERIINIKIIEGEKEADPKQLPKHLQEFLELQQQQLLQNVIDNNNQSSDTMKEECTTTTKTSSTTMSTKDEKHRSIASASCIQTTTTSTASTGSNKVVVGRSRPVKQLRKVSSSTVQQKPHSRSVVENTNHCQLSNVVSATISPVRAAAPTTLREILRKHKSEQQKQLHNNRDGENKMKKDSMPSKSNRRSFSENDLLHEIDKCLVVAKGFIFARAEMTATPPPPPPPPKPPTPVLGPKFKAKGPKGIWSPNSKSVDNLRTCGTTTTSSTQHTNNRGEQRGDTQDPKKPVWTPNTADPSPTFDRKEFRPVNFESPTFQRKVYTRQESDPVPPPWRNPLDNQQKTTAPLQQSLSTSNLSNYGFTRNHNVINLPRTQNPTVTLLQKAREGQIPRVTQQFADHINQQQQQQLPNHFARINIKQSNPLPAFMNKPNPNEIVHNIRREYMSESETDNDRSRKMTESLTPRSPVEGIGPMTKDGMPIVLRSEVNENNQSRWYKKMYNTLHKAKDDGRYPYKPSNGYMSEPEPNYESDYSVKYNTLDRRRIPSTGSQQYYEKSYGTMPNPVKPNYEHYKNQPGRIENYTPGRSSISEKETRQWWDEVMDIFDGWLDENYSPLPYFSIVFAREVQKFHLEQQKHVPKHFAQGYLSKALNEGGYESDSSLLFKKQVESNLAPLSPVEQKQMYRNMQSGGEPPLQGFRKPAPEKPKDDQEIEYFPITSTLTKMRVHRNKFVSEPTTSTGQQQREVLCYPITSVTKPIDLFGSYSSTARSFIPISPPPPPSRRSSKRNTILKMFSGSTHTSLRASAKSPNRHEACFATSDRYLESKKSPGSSSFKKSCESLRSKSAGPLGSYSRSSLKEEKNMENTTRIARRQYVRVSSVSPVNRSRMSESRKSSPSPVAFGRGISRERTFAEEKKRLELQCQDIRAPTRMLRNPALKSPDEVKRALQTTFRLPSRERNACIKTTVSSGRRTGTANAFRATSSVVSSKKSPVGDKNARVSVNRERSVVETSTPARLKTSSPKVTTSVVYKQNSGRISKPLEKSRSKTCISNSNVSLARTNSTYSIDSSSSKKKSSSRPHTIIRSNSKGNLSPVTVSGSKTSRRRRISASKEKIEIKKKNGVAVEESKIEQEIYISSNDRRPADHHENQRRDRNDADEKEVIQALNTAIVEQKGNVRGEHFFQNLFCRNLPSPTPSSSSSLYRNTSVLEKAKLWNTISHKSEPTLPQQNVYLANRKPVSCSKFKILEQEHANSRMSRSLSPNRAYRTNRIVADHITKFDSLCQLSSEDDEEFGNITKSLTFSYQERSRSEPPKQHTILTEIQQPFEPVVIHGRTKSIEYRSESPARSARSPSCRRIHSFRSHQSSSDATDNHYKRVNRARSLGSADRSPSRQSLIEQSYNDLSRSSCSLNLNYERHNSACNHQRSDRFKELNQFYSTLERVGQLERATSTSDIRPIRGDEEVIDFDLWKRIREREKAEKELNYLVRKLKEEQKEKDFLFQPHDVDDLRWDRRRDSGLRIKEKSVEDLRETFHKKAQEANHDVNENVKQKMDSDKGTYKLLYRGSSVLDLASNMVEKYNPPEKGDAPKSKVKEFSKREDKPLGLSTKLISTLSKDQINKIKHQLSEIYSNSPLPTQKASEKYEEISEKFVITVPPPPQSTSKDKSILTVRSNSLLTREELLNPVLAKHQSRLSERAESIGTINESKTRTERSTSDNRPEVNPLSESDKRRLSETLCREIKDRVSQRRQEKQDLHPKETRGAFAAEQAKLSLPDCRTVRPRSQSEENYPSTSSQASRLESVAIRREKKSALDKRRPASVCESVASSEASNHTVIFKQIQQQSHQKNISEDVRAKIKYFEEIKKEDPLKGTTIYHAREDSSPDEEEVMKAIEEKLKAKKAQEEQRSRSPGLSSSVTDIREMFGEKQFSSFQSVERKSHSVPPPSSNPEKRYSTTEVIIHETHPVSDHSSFESVYRSRSISPNLEKQHKSYLNLVKTGDVKKIKDKFESLDVSLTNSYWSECEPTPPPPKSPRRYRSDPELDKEFFEKRGTSPKKITVKDHEAGDVSRITHRFELRNSSASSSSSRGRSRTRRERRAISPIPKVSMKKDDRFMPHIDIISKTALLKHEIKCPSASWPSRHNPVSEVRETMETQENMSILGQMYTSTPDFRELKDISSYLSGSWVAHQFPRPQDNARSLTHPQKTAENEKIKKRLSPRPSSTSPPRNKSLITSILKPYYDIFADQKFDPNVHRPKYRYVPGKQLEAEALWKKLQHNINKPSVKFEEPAVVPPPPPQKGVPLHSSQSPESPRRYIEGDVNIHYRTPIRHEFKELIPEDELAHRQAEAMRRLYQEEKRRKYLQELQDMNNRRHTDNFTPSQKSPIALNRYDTFQADLSPKSPVMQTRTVARALYNFQGQSARELSFRKGDLIYIRRQIDKNWYEGEQNANVGLFPSNYVEIITKDTQRAAPSKRPAEGQARAKFNFTAASAIELSLNKGEIVTLTRRVDDNWFEGKIANRKGIFPVTYVEVLHEIGTETKPVGSPAAHSLIITPTLEQSTSKDLYATTNGSSLTNGGRLTNGGGTNGDLVRDSKGQHKTEVLHVDTNSEPIAFRALYKYSPQNSDELELQEGDIVYVLEKCDDGWYVGTSHRTGYFGTFPGNYVELM